jgi:hypothetical protein
MFAEEGAIELPYLTDFGFPPRYVGREQITQFLHFARDLYPDFDFEKVSILINTPEQVFAEYEFTAVSSKTGETIHLLIFGRLVAENGKIKLLREALSAAEVARCLSPGIPDLPQNKTAVNGAQSS